MEHSPAWKRFEVDNISIEPGQTITLWLRINKDGEDYRAEQVEVRVTFDHRAEVFCATEIQKTFQIYTEDKLQGGDDE